MATHWLKSLSHKAAYIKMLNPVYNASLGKPDDLLSFESFPPDIFGGDAGRGRWAASGQLDIGGHRVPLDHNGWFIGGDQQGTPFFEKLHAFDFLPELKALGGETGRRAAREVTARWLDFFQNYHHILWSPDLTAQRLVNWLIAYPFAFEAASDDFLELFHTSFYRQYKHLVQLLAAKGEMNPFDRYSLLWAVIIVECHCTDLYDDLSFQSHLQLLKGVVDEASLNDGGIISKNLQNLLQFSKSLIQLRDSLIQTSKPIPAWIEKRTEETVRIINSLTHTDKDFPTFQDTVLPNRQEIEAVTKQSGVRLRRSQGRYPDYGYTSLRNGKTSVIIDHGDKGTHAAPLAFEMSYGANRMIVSCGYHLTDPQWQDGFSLLAAHSALSVGEAEPKQNVMNAQTFLENLNGAALFCGSHNGYVPAFSLTHTRRLYLDAEGEDFRGEELLTRNIAIKDLNVLIRFHLYPAVKASLVESKASVLLRLPSGAGWMFKVQGGSVALEDSVHCADGFTIRKTQQIVVRTNMDDLSLQLKWALKKQ